MRTLTVKQGGSSWSTGWHTLTITTAKYGTYNESKFLEIGFKDYPDNFTLRIYAKVGKDGEEFVIGNVFRFANAGITEVLEGTGGDKVAKIDDSAEQMVGKELNILFYKDGDYTRAYSSVAPVPFENAIDTFTEKDVEYWKGRAETRFQNYTPGNGTVDAKDSVTTETGSIDIPHQTTEATIAAEELPF